MPIGQALINHIWHHALTPGLADGYKMQSDEGAGDSFIDGVGAGFNSTVSRAARG